MARALSAGEGSLPFPDPAKLLNASCCAESGAGTGTGGGVAEIGRGGEEEAVEEEEGERGAVGGARQAQVPSDEMPPGATPGGLLGAPSRGPCVVSRSGVAGASQPSGRVAADSECARSASMLIRSSSGAESSVSA